MKTANATITLESVIQQKAEECLICSKLGDELVMMNLHTGNYISINRIGTIIWNSIADPICVEQLVEILKSKFDVSREKCIEDTLECLNSMLKQEIIELKVTN